MNESYSPEQHFSQSGSSKPESADGRGLSHREDQTMSGVWRALQATPASRHKDCGWMIAEKGREPGVSSTLRCSVCEVGIVLQPCAHEK